MSQNPLFTYVWPATIFEPVVVGVSVPTFGEVGDAYVMTGLSLVPVFSEPLFG